MFVNIVMNVLIVFYVNNDPMMTFHD